MPARSTKKSNADQSNAPGQLLGYGLQETRLTALLLEAPEGSMCSVELLDDVALVEASGSQTFIQSKSALTSNPVADRAPSLWKTLSIWARQVGSGKADPEKTLFELYVSRPVGGEVVEAFHKASDLDSAQKALAKARTSLYGDGASDTSTVPNLPESLKKHTDEFFDHATNELSKIIQNFRLVCGTGSPHDDLESIIRRGPVSPSKVADIADHMCGWVKREAEKLLEQARPAIISRDAFHEKYRAYCHRVDRRTILQSISSKPEGEQTRREVDSQPNFIRQLMFIESPFDDLLGAASDCYRASVDRTAWAKAGDVDEDSLDELNETLERTWQNNQERCAIIHDSLSDVKRGKLLHLECMRFQTNVQGMQVPPYFIAGCFHLLADEPVIGWHPNYAGLLTKREEENSG